MSTYIPTALHLAPAFTGFDHNFSNLLNLSGLHSPPANSKTFEYLSSLRILRESSIDDEEIVSKITNELEEYCEKFEIRKASENPKETFKDLLKNADEMIKDVTARNSLQVLQKTFGSKDDSQLCLIGEFYLELIKIAEERKADCSAIKQNSSFKFKGIENKEVPKNSPLDLVIKYRHHGTLE